VTVTYDAADERNPAERPRDRLQHVRCGVAHDRWSAPHFRLLTVGDVRCAGGLREPRRAADGPRHSVRADTPQPRAVNTGSDAESLTALDLPPTGRCKHVYVRDDGREYDCARSGAPRAWPAAVGRYLEALRITHYAADTVHVRRLYLKYFSAWATAHGIARPEGVARADVERYQRWLYDYRKRTGGPLSVWSQHARLVAVKGLFRWLTKQHAVTANPATELELPRVIAQRLPQPLTDAEIARVLAGADVTTAIGLRDRALLETGYSTGLRRMELIRLRFCDLDLARGVLAVRAGKGQKDRVVPIGEGASAWLEQYLDEARPALVVAPDEGTVFLTRRGGAFIRIISPAWCATTSSPRGSPSAGRVTCCVIRWRRRCWSTGPTSG